GRGRVSPDYAARLIDDVKQAGGSDNDAAATATAPLSLHDALPILRLEGPVPSAVDPGPGCRFHSRCPRKLGAICESTEPAPPPRSVEHTSELQSRSEIVCRLLLEKKKEHPPRPGAPGRRPRTHAAT